MLDTFNISPKAIKSPIFKRLKPVLSFSKKTPVF
jgi:hypothetical protein